MRRPLTGRKDFQISIRKRKTSSRRGHGGLPNERGISYVLGRKRRRMNV